jgi:hypothetical protein
MPSRLAPSAGITATNQYGQTSFAGNRRNPPMMMRPATPTLSPMMREVLRQSQMKKAQEAQQAASGMPMPGVLPMSKPTPPPSQPSGFMGAFSQPLTSPVGQAISQAAIAGARASDYSPTPVSLGRVLAEMGAGAMQGYTSAQDRGVKNLLAQAQLAKALRPETTTLMQNLAAAGIDPSSPEGQKIIRDSLTRPGTTVMTGGEGEFIKEGVKAGFSALGAAQKEVQNDRALFPRVQQIIDILSDPNADTGVVASVTMGFRKLGRDLGFLNEEQEQTLTNQEVLQSAISFMVPKMRVVGSGASSDKDVELMQEAVPTMDKSPEANRIIASLYKQTMDYNKRRLGIMGDYLRAEKNLLGFEEYADEQMGRVYQRIGSAEDMQKAEAQGLIKEGDVYWSVGAKQFKIAGS